MISIGNLSLRKCAAYCCFSHSSILMIISEISSIWNWSQVTLSCHQMSWRGNQLIQLEIQVLWTQTSVKNFFNDYKRFQKPRFVGRGCVCFPPGQYFTELSPFFCTAFMFMVFPFSAPIPIRNWKPFPFLSLCAIWSSSLMNCASCCFCFKTQFQLL